MKQLLTQIDNVWINASAGSGKTTKLINRILQLMLCHNTAPKILCLTFTNAAATEMQKRIVKKLKQWENYSSEQLFNDLSTTLGSNFFNLDVNSCKTLITKAKNLYANKAHSHVRINTIHAFCTNILHTFASELNISPTFQIIDEQRQLLLLKQALHDWCQQCNTRNTTIPNKQILLECCRIILSMCDVSNIKNFFHNTITNLQTLFHVEQYKINKNNLIADTEISAMQNQTIIENYNTSRILKLLQDNNFWQKHQATISKWLSGQQNALLFFNEYKAIFLTKNNEPRKKSVKFSKTMQSLWFEEQQAVLALHQALCHIEEYVKNYNVIFICCKLLQQLKQNKYWQNMLSYRDIIFATSQALLQASCCETIKYHISRTTDHLLIDEAQDNSREQWLMIKVIAEDFLSGHTVDNIPKTLFVVGDAKQSIYSFQGADPAFFTEMQTVFMEKAKLAQRQISIIESHDCYRCGKKIINTVNALLQQKNFQQAAILGPILPMHISHSNLEGVVRWSPIVLSQKNELPVAYPDSNKIYQGTETMATQIATDIKSWIENSKDIGTEQPICFADIMILVRKRDEFLTLLMAALNRNSIPYLIEGPISCADNLLLQDFLSIAKVAINANDYMSLCIVLKSWMFGYNDNHLLHLRQHNFELNTISIYDQLVIKNLRYMSVLNATPHDFFCGVFFRLGCLETLCKKFGNMAYELVDSWLTALLELERKNNVFTLQSLLTFCKQHDIILPQITTHPTNKVFLGTIHAAKGKESPVVIVAQAKQIIAKNDPLEVFNGMPFYAWCRSDQITALKHKIRQKLYEEELRLLYVALTRAKNELHFYSLDNDDIDQSEWRDILHAAFN